MADRFWAFKARDWCPANPAASDCSPGLQNMFNTAPSHSRILFSNGTYLMLSGITITKPVVVMCESMSGCLFDANLGASSSPVFKLSGTDDSAWQHGAIDRDQRSGPGFEIDGVNHVELIRASIIRADPYVAIRARAEVTEHVTVAMCRGTLARDRGMLIGATTDQDCDVIASCFNIWESDATKGTPSRGEEWVKGDMHFTQGGLRKGWTAGVYRHSTALYYVSDGGWGEGNTRDYDGAGIGALIGRSSWANGLDSNRWIDIGRA